MQPDTGTTKLSIIIPTLNEEKLISNILNIFNKEFKEKFRAELIISDGGSSDETLKLITDNVDKVIRHDGEFKQNISRGRNQGAKSSKGDVLVFLNADTFIYNPDELFEEALELLNHPDNVAIAFPIRVFKDEEKLFDKIFHGFYNLYVKMLNNVGIGMGRGECHMVKRDYFEILNGYNENLYAGEDYDLYKRLRKKGKIVFANKLVVYESPRRYRLFGYPKVIYNWLINSVFVTLFKKSVSKDWEPVR